MTTGARRPRPAVSRFGKERGIPEPDIPARPPSDFETTGRRASIVGLGAFGADPARALFFRVMCLGVAVLGWVYVAIMGAVLLHRSPPAAGFDLQLLLDAARRVAGGGSPYDPNAVAHGLTATDLFYSYPPVVAQALVPISGLPTWLILTFWCIGAGVGVAAMSALLARAPIGRPAKMLPALPLDAALLTLAAAPLFFPLTSSLWFGNVDAWFPLLVGLVVLTLPAEGLGPSRMTSLAGGAALALAAAIKLHPGSLVVWLALRRRSRSPRWPYAAVLAGVIATGAAILLVSLLLGGAGPWHDYIDYLRVSSAADLADRLNIGPASQLALLVDNHGLAHGLAVVFAVVAIAGTVVASRLVRDTLESFGWAVVASLILLPVTWYHYPVALIPVAVAAWTRSRGMPQARRVSIALFIAWILADAAIALPVTTWIAVALVLVAVRTSRPSSSPTLGQVAPTVEAGLASGGAIDRVEVISK